MGQCSRNLEVQKEQTRGSTFLWWRGRGLFSPMPPDLTFTSPSHFFLLPPLLILMMTATHEEYYITMCRALC